MLLDQLDKHLPITHQARSLLLSAVAKSGDISLAKTVLERAVFDANALDIDGHTVLDRAVLYGDLPLVDLLLVLDGIHLNSTDWDGFTALALAMKKLSDDSGFEKRPLYEACVEKLLRHKDVTTLSLDPYWLVEFITLYLDDGGDQKLVKLFILKDPRLVSDTVVHEVDAVTLLEWAQQNQHRAIVRALKEKERRIRTATEAGRQSNTWKLESWDMINLVQVFLAQR